MKQSPKKSLIESVTHTVMGLGIPITIVQNVIITLVFFFVSIIRGYFVRRIFEKLLRLKTKI